MHPTTGSNEASGSPIRDAALHRKVRMHSAAQHAADQCSEPGGHKSVPREHHDSHQPELAVVPTGHTSQEQDGELAQEHTGDDGSRPARSQEAEEEPAPE